MTRYNVKEALSLGLTEFECKYPCNNCYGRRRKIVAGVSKCLDCTIHGSSLSLGKINSAQNKHNNKVKKDMYRNVTIPVVFSGMSTVPK